MFLRFSAGISSNHPNSTRKLEETSRRKKFCNYKTEQVLLGRKWGGKEYHPKTGILGSFASLFAK